MSQHSHEDDVIPNATAIVERFGGIRPMASKLNVPVTTVQGWKKRDAIPGIRREEILTAAAHYDVDLKGLVGETANENSRKSTIAEDPALSNVRAMPQPAPQPQRNQHFSNTQTVGAIDMRQVKSIARRTSFVTTVGLVALVAAAGFLLFGGPERVANNNQPRVAALEGRVTSLEQQQQQSQPGALRQAITAVEQKVDALTSNMPAMSDRLNALEALIRQGGSPALAGVAQQVQQMAQSPDGQVDWQAAITDLRGIVTQMQGRMDGFDSALQLAKSDNDALGRTLSEVSGRDLGAAAMLLTLTQVRSSIDRQTPFADDLDMLRAMAGNSDPELAQSIDKMAPYAETGVLSAGGLKRELQAASNDIITAKLKGEDVSIKDKILGRLEALFSIKKDGANVAGGSERELIDQAITQLDAGDVAGAQATMNQLQGPAAEAAAPWKNKANGTVAAQGLESQLVKSLVAKMRTTISSVTTGSAPINMAPMQQPQAAMPAPAPAPMPEPVPAPVMDGMPSQAAPTPVPGETLAPQPEGQAMEPNFMPAQPPVAQPDPNAPMAQAAPGSSPAPQPQPEMAPPSVTIQQ